MIKIILLFFKEGEELLKKGFYIEEIKSLPIINEIMRINQTIRNEDFSKIEKLKKKLLKNIEYLKLTRGVFKKR